MDHPVVTKVKFFPPDGVEDRNVRCRVSVFLNDSLVLNGVLLCCNRSETWYLRMPTHFAHNLSRRIESFHPLTSQFYNYLLDEVVSAYTSGVDKLGLEVNNRS